jgi:dienelactone hydrolase
MIEERVEIRTADGTADGFLYRPGDGSRRPGVIHLTDIGGIRPSLTGLLAETLRSRTETR